MKQIHVDQKKLELALKWNSIPRENASTETKGSFTLITLNRLYKYDWCSVCGSISIKHPKIWPDWMTPRPTHPFC
jgi:hypothetical protein